MQYFILMGHYFFMNLVLPGVTELSGERSYSFKLMWIAQITILLIIGSYIFGLYFSLEPDTIYKASVYTGYFR